MGWTETAYEHRALVICSKSELHAELEKLETIFPDNGYPKFFGCSKVCSTKVPNLFETTMDWYTSLQFERQIRQAITKCFFAVNPQIV